MLCPWYAGLSKVLVSSLTFPVSTACLQQWVCPSMSPQTPGEVAEFALTFRLLRTQAEQQAVGPGTPISTWQEPADAHNCPPHPHPHPQPRRLSSSLQKHRDHWCPSIICQEISASHSGDLGFSPVAAVTVTQMSQGSYVDGRRSFLWK